MSEVSINGNVFEIEQHDDPPVEGALEFETEEEAQEYIRTHFPGAGKVN